MKKTITILIMAAIATMMWAQPEKGKFTMIFQTGFNSPSNNNEMTRLVANAESNGFGIQAFRQKDGDLDQKVTIVSFSPQVGYFFTKELMAGAGITYASINSNSTRGSSNSKTQTNYFSAGPFARYYIPMNKRTVLPFLQAGLSFGKYKYTDRQDEEDITINTSNYGGGLGVSIFLKDNVAVEALLGYHAINYKANISWMGEDLNTKQNMITFNVGFNVLLGK